MSIGFRVDGSPALESSGVEHRPLGLASKPMDRSTPTTELLTALRAGDPGALDVLIPRVYEEIRRIAHRERARRGSGETLRTTALINEAYLKLVDQSEVEVHDRAHFLALAATVVRHLIIDDARRRGSKKRGGGWQQVSLAAVADSAPNRHDLLALDDALRRLAAFDERLAKVVECRYFGGLTIEETATALGLSPRSVDRAWKKARAWLYREVHEAE